ncbi:TobH protein [Mycolicibacillus koreensis]|uniref:TobH protein n=1 Tax=Mycolicibacillus koreensis TaxID=1069220 RepID=A0A7I7SFJ2_9MYCO|nr:TobH protein [Mycolicibacillus koreensis]BBY54765.1 hypothetical protein MKOR_20160 [Mycolicibacillus koreensis]
MSLPQPLIDLDDGDGLLTADAEGLLRAAAMAGAQVRSTAEAVAEGALADIGGRDPARTLIWVGGRGTASSAGALLAALLGGSAGQPVIAVGEVPPWIGPLDVLVVAGDDPGDPVLVAAVALGVRRGARVVIVAPSEGPLRDAGAGRAAVLAPRVAVPEPLRLSGYLAAGLAVAGAVDARIGPDLAALADALDGEALRSSAGRDLVTNPAKTLVQRMAGHQVVLAGDDAATVALARHGSAVVLRLGRTAVAATGLADAIAATHGGPDPTASIFHDEQIDGPLPPRLRVLALTLSEQRTLSAARIAGRPGVEMVAAGDIAEQTEAREGDQEGDRVAADPLIEAGTVPVEQQLGVLAVRLEMAAVYLGLGAGMDGG